MKTVVYIGHYPQRVVYEGMNRICFSCGKMGHKNTTCLDLIPINTFGQGILGSSPKNLIELSIPLDELGPWMVVQIKRKNLLCIHYPPNLRQSPRLYNKVHLLVWRKAKRPL